MSFIGEGVILPLVFYLSPQNHGLIFPKRSTDNAYGRNSLHVVGGKEISKWPAIQLEQHKEAIAQAQMCLLEA